MVTSAPSSDGFCDRYTAAAQPGAVDHGHHNYQLPILALTTHAPDAGVLLAAAPEILSVALVAAMALMLNAAGLEAHAAARLDLGR